MLDKQSDPQRVERGKKLTGHLCVSDVKHGYIKILAVVIVILKIELITMHFKKDFCFFRVRKRVRFEMPGTPLSHLQPPQEQVDNNNDDRAERGSIQAENQRSLIEADLRYSLNGHTEVDIGRHYPSGDVCQDPPHSERSPLLSNGGRRCGTYSSLNSL